MTIEELYKLIDEIEKDNLEYKNTIRDRKRRRILKERKNKIRKLLSFIIPLSLIGAINLKALVDAEVNNIYNGSKLKISEEKIQKLKDEIENKLNIDVYEPEIEEYLLLDALLKNLNLSNQEKQVIGQELINIIKMNPYLNKEQVYEALLKLNIFHIERPKNKDSTLQGECIVIDTLFLNIDNIYIYTEEEEVLEHELIHSIMMKRENYGTPYFMKEGLTELLTLEFFSENPYLITECYPFECLAIKMLCEITDPNTVLESYTTGKMNILYQKLNTINSNIDAKKFIEVLDNILKKDLYNQKRDNEEIEYLINCWKNYYFASLNADPQAFNNYLNLFMSLKSNDPYMDYLTKLDKYGYIKKAYYKSNIEESNRIKKVKKL